MAVETPPYVLQGASHGAELFRRAISTLTTTGIVAQGDYQVTATSTASMSVNVAGGDPGGQAWVPGTISDQQGAYYVFNDAVVNLPIAAASTVDPRIDLVCLTVEDAYYAGSANTATVQVITGTPASSPVAPGLPANSLALATVSVATSATSITSADITDQRVVAASGIAKALFRGVISQSGLDIAVGSHATVPMGGVALDTAGGSNGTGYTVPAGYGGIYELGFHVEMNPTAAGELYGFVQLDVNGTAVLTGDWYTAGTALAPASGLSVFELAAGSVIDVIVDVAAGGGPGNVLYDESRNYMTVVQLT